MENTNIIPDMVDPLGKYWEQPNKKDILIDNEHAVMSDKTYLQLKNYSSSIPSGVYDGKMWRDESKEGKFLCWYAQSDEPDKCSINTRKVLFINPSL